MTIDESLSQHISVMHSLAALNVDIMCISDVVIRALAARKKIFVCGNGGSAADAQHFATELTVRYEKNRRAHAAIALTTDTSALTAISNDFGAEQVFSRQLEALANEGDVLIAISTSGNSTNVLRAIEMAKKLNVKTVGLLGAGGGAILPHVDHAVLVPSNRTARIQEAHIFILHVMCEAIDREA